MSEKSVTVNDGNGLYDNSGLCDTLIRDLNRLPKMLLDGQYIQFCDCISSMGKRLANLKKGIESDMESMRGKVEDLKRMNACLEEQLTGQPGAKGGVDNGTD